MLSFNARVQRLVSTFMSYRNDVDIYTEDEEKDKEFYKSLFRKLIDHKIKITDVTPLGCKDNVLKACNEALPNGRKKLFIIDGDINLINKKKIYNHPDLYVHNAYCVENLLLDKNSICKFVYFQCAVKSFETIISEINFENWLSKYKDAFVELFLHFATVDTFDLPFTLYNSLKYHNVEQKRLVYDENLVTRAIADIKSEALKKISQKDLDDELARLRVLWNSDIETFLKITSGKDYLIPIILLKTSEFKKSKAQNTLQEVKLSLLEYSNLASFQPLKERIEAL